MNTCIVVQQLATPRKYPLIMNNTKQVQIPWKCLPFPQPPIIYNIKHGVLLNSPPYLVNNIATICRDYMIFIFTRCIGVACHMVFSLAFYYVFFFSLAFIVIITICYPIFQYALPHLDAVVFLARAIKQGTEGRTYQQKKKKMKHIASIIKQSNSYACCTHILL